MDNRLVQNGIEDYAAVIAAGIEGLTAIPGIGKKTAEKLLAEAREAIEAEAFAGEEPGVREPAPSEVNPQPLPAGLDLAEMYMVANMLDVPVIVGPYYLYPGASREHRGHDIEAALSTYGAESLRLL